MIPLNPTTIWAALRLYQALKTQGLLPTKPQPSLRQRVEEKEWMEAWLQELQQKKPLG